MPKIIIQKREDLTGKIRLSVNSNSTLIDRAVSVEVSDAELNALKSSHEAPYITIIEEIDDTNSSIGSDPDYRRNETGPGPHTKLR